MSSYRVYNPVVQKGSFYYALPLPLNGTTESFSNDIRSAKIPLVDGEIVTSASRGPLTVNFNGLIVSDSHSRQMRIKDALVELFTLSVGQSLTFYRYYSPSVGLERPEYYRWYKNCYVRDLSFEHTTRSERVLPYSFTLFVPDGREYEAGTYIDDIVDKDWVSGSEVILETDPGLGAGGGMWAEGEQTGGGPLYPPVSTLVSPDGVIYGPLIINLDDADGDSAVLVTNSNGDIVAKINSVGDIYVAGAVVQVDSIEDA